MAEVAGLVIGGAGLATLFDGCMNAFEYIESGVRYGREYNALSLKVSILQLRLTRWKAKVHFAEDDISSAYRGAQIASWEEQETVRHLLGQIHAEFEIAQVRASSYRTRGGPPAAQRDLEREETTIAALTVKVKALAHVRQKAASMRQKAKWALHDQKRFQTFIEDQTRYIDGLVQLFPAMEIKQKALAEEDAATLVEPADSSESKAENLGVLAEAASGVDEMLEEAVNKVASQGVLIDQYGSNVRVTDKGRFLQGDFFAPGYKGPVRQNNAYLFKGTVTVDREARSHQGTAYGTKYVLDD